MTREKIYLLIILISISFASAQVTNETVGGKTHWFVDIHDGIGTDTGDGGVPQGDGTIEYVLSSPFKLGIKTTIEVNTSINESNIINTSENAVIVGNTNTQDNLNTTGDSSTKDERNFKPIVIWGIVVFFLLALIIGGWYIYQDINKEKEKISNYETEYMEEYPIEEECI